MPVTLPGAPSGADVFGAGVLKNGSSFQELLAGAGGAGAGAGVALRGVLLKNSVKLPPEDEDARGGGTGAAAGAAGLGTLVNNCVKPPSAEAESDAPCDENPVDFDAAAGGGTGRGVSSEGREGGV